MSFLEFSYILRIPRMKVICGFSKEAFLSCVCFFGKGDDFKDIFHAFYYKDKYAFKALLKHILTFKKAPTLFLRPDERKFFPRQNRMEFSSLMIKDDSNPNTVKKIENEKLFIRSLQGI
jgi:hypothetical protein